MVNANELEFKERSVKLKYYLIESKDSWLRTHFSLVCHSIFDENEFKEDFPSLQETSLIPVLKRDDLKVEEIKIWDYVIKWRITQNPTLLTDSKEWSNENFEALKITLQRYLPLIDIFIYFCIISAPNLPLTFNLNIILAPNLSLRTRPPNSISTLDSSLGIISTPPKLPFSTRINKEHVAEPSSWINRNQRLIL
ncbi:hypothetical protein Glove_482g70 [Diversispora epigaea]|uniref:BACK domain-containing protein n=1 Tax=Diversispora epigaea TaxID=1348612 RepID=A0A397GJM4_9GLOM|nr:hypothetical protein Glove_482g70 [Diversispora epigaea]